MPGLAAVFFDGDGTLWDFERLMRRALTIALGHLRTLRPCHETSALDVDALVHDRRVVERGLSGAGLRLEELRLKAFERSLQRIGMPDGALAQVLNDVYLRERFTNVPLFEDVLPVLHDLRQRMPIGLLSNGNGYPERSGLGGLFKACVFSDDYGITKPDRRLFDIAADAIGADPARLALVGDSLTADVTGALDAGWAAIWINRAGSTSGCPAGVIEIATLHDLSAALQLSPQSAHPGPDGPKTPDDTPSRLGDVDLWQFYDKVEKLITDLRSAGHAEEADEVELAIRGGATSGEVLGRLSAALPDVADRAPQFTNAAHDLASWARQALKL